MEGRVLEINLDVVILDVCFNVRWYIDSFCLMIFIFLVKKELMRLFMRIGVGMVDWGLKRKVRVWYSCGGEWRREFFWYIRRINW